MIPHTIARAALRVVAVAIAIAALVDPVATIARAPRRVVVARLASSEVAVAERALSAGLPGVELDVRPAANRRLPCAPAEPCVIVADGSVDVDIPGDLPGPVSLIKVGPAGGANVAIQSVAASRTQHAAAAGSLHVALGGVAVKGRRTEVRVTDGAATVGSAIHDWVLDGDAAIDIPWWPIAEGPRVLRVAAVPFDGEASALDNAVEAGVTVSSGRAPVLVFDARPSWASTFVRRALEDDSRFQVEHRVGVAPLLGAGTPGGRLDAPALAAASIVIVGGPEGLGAGDVALLEQFVRVRGGTLILLPDRTPSGAAARLFAGRWTEHLEASASPIGPLRASETIRLAAASPVDVVLGSIMGSPAIVLSPAGHGRVVISGAMDAWRYRDAESGAFDRFWRSVVLESAAASAPLRLELAGAIAAPGTTVPFTVRYRQMTAATSAPLTATASCGDRIGHTIRLWPKGAAGVFAGQVPIEGTEPCEVGVAVDGGPAVAGGIAVTSGATASVSAVMSKLARHATSTGGVVSDAGAEGTVVAALAAAAPPTASRQPGHPMRSPWWMFPFVTCLGVEWWLRRRAGLR